MLCLVMLTCTRIALENNVEALIIELGILAFNDINLVLNLEYLRLDILQSDHGHHFIYRRVGRPLNALLALPFLF